MLKTHNEHCKAPGSVKVSKSSTLHHGSKRGVENQDPSAPKRGAITANKLKGVSRLPVLAKSLQLLATTDPTQMKWQERPLLGKEKRKKACTKPQPFNLSQPRVSRLGTPKQEQASLGNAGKVRTLPTTRPTQPPPTKTQSTLHPKPKTGTAVPSRTKPADPGTFCGASKNIGSLSAQTSTLNGATVDQCHNVLSRLEHGGSITENQTLHREPDSLPTLRCTVPGSHATDKTATLLDVFKDISISLSSSKQAASAIDAGLSEACGHKTPFRTPRSHAAPQRVAVKTKSQTAHPTPGFCKPGNTTDGFCPDPSALRSILQSEGVTASGLQGTTPRPSFCPSGRATSVYLPQRVSVLKSAQRKKAESNTGKAQTFFPDPAALGSILRNEGVQPGGPSGGATPHISTCPSGRATSIYTAQRVPVSKSRTEGGSGAQGNSVTFSPDLAALSSILQNEGIQTGGATPRPSARGTSIYTAQRVPVTKSRAELIAASLGPARSSPGLSPAVKWTPLRVPNTKPQSTKRLLSVYRTPKFSGSPGLRCVQTPSAELPAHKEDDVVQTLFKEKEEEEKMEDEEEPQAVPELEAEAKPLVTEEAEMAGPQQAEEMGSRGPFLQAVHRESVIMLCSGQNLFRQTPARGTTPATDTPAPSSTLKPHCPNTQPAGTLPGPLQQASGSKVTANLESTVPAKVTSLCQKRAALELRRRLPALEELFLDEECANYMSQPQYCVALPRCSNPVANRLLFQDSTCFLPIGQLTSPGPTSCAV